MVKKDLIWNLDDDLEIPSKIIRDIFFHVKIKKRKIFCNWIGEISKNYANDLNWWVANPASRNPFQSNLFNYFCILETIRKLSKLGYPIKIETSSRNLYKIIKNWSLKQKNSKILIKRVFNSRHKENNSIYILKTVLFYIFIFASVKILKKKNRYIYQKPFTIMENYILYDFDENKNYNKNFNNKKKQKVLLVPNFLINKRLTEIIKIIKQLDPNKYLFREHFLKIKDLISSFLHFWRKKRFLKRYKKLLSWDLSLIINDEIKSNKNFFSSVSGLLNYKFFKRLNEQDISLKKTICLFENQASGRGWSLGNRTFFPSVENLGFQGYVNFSQYLNSIPCEFEEKAKVLPNKISVISNVLKKGKKEFYSKFKVICAPSLKLNFNNKIFKKKQKNEIILILTGIKIIDEKLINWSLKFIENNKKIKLTIKTHPILPLRGLDFKIVNSLKENIHFSNDSINEILKKSVLIISTVKTKRSIK